MKIPLDYLCVKTGVLCPRCQRLVDTGVVKKYEVPVMRALLELEDKPGFRFLKSSTYVKALKFDDVMILIIEVSGSVVTSRELGRLGRILSEKLGIRVKVVNRSGGNLRDLAMQLVYPARVTGVNTLWLPDGSVEHIVRVPRSDLRYLPTRITSIEEALSKISGVNVKIRIEY